MTPTLGVGLVMLLRQPAGDEIGNRLGLLESGAVPQPRERVQDPAAAVIVQETGGPGDRQVYLRFGERERADEPWWDDADNRAHSTVEAHGLADDRRVAVEPLTPRRVPQHDDRVNPPRRSFGAVNEPAECRLDAEQLEIVSGDPRRQHAGRTLVRRSAKREGGSVFRREPDETDAIPCDVVEDVSRRGSIILEVGKRHRAQGRRPRATAAEDHQPLTPAHGQRPKQQRIDDAEDRRVDTDAESEGEYGPERKRAMLAQRATRIADVVEEIRRASASESECSFLCPESEVRHQIPGRGIPPRGVAPRSNTPGILVRRALPAGRLGATPGFTTGC